MLRELGDLQMLKTRIRSIKKGDQGFLGGMDIQPIKDTWVCERYIEGLQVI